MKSICLLLTIVGIALASPIVKRDAPYPPALPHSTYGEPIVKTPAPFKEPAILIKAPETPANEYGPPEKEFIAPPAPILPPLPKIPEIIISPIPETPKIIEAPLPIDTRFDAPYPPPAAIPSEYGPPPAPVVKEIPLAPPAEEYGPPQTSFIAPPAPALPELPKLPELIIHHVPETPKTIEAPLPTPFDAPYPPPLDIPTSYGPPPAIVKEIQPIIVEEPAAEYGPPLTSFIAPPAPALPELPKLPETVIRHFPEAPKEIATIAKFDAPYPPPSDIPTSYGPPPVIKEALPAAPAEEYGPPVTAFVAPAAPALPELPKLPENPIIHFPEAPKEIAAPLPVATTFNAPYPPPSEIPTSYGPPPSLPEVKEIKPIIVEAPAEEYGPPAAAFVAPPAPALPELPKLPEIVIPHIPETPKIIEAPLPVIQTFQAPHEEYGVPTTTTTTLPPPTTTTVAVPTGPYPAAGPVSHYGDPIHKSTPFFIRVNSKSKGFSFVEIGGQVVARNNKLLVDEGSFTYFDNNSNPIHVKYQTNN